jgi:thiamine pyrophosphate-dependent acetolactate synthase large subunit-like protein
MTISASEASSVEHGGALRGTALARADGHPLALAARRSAAGSSTRVTRAIDAGLARVQPDVHPTLLAVAGGYDMAMIAGAQSLGYTVIGARSEGGAAFIAAALAWDTERPVLLIVITSPGVYGTLQALHYAYVSRVPLVLLSGESSLPGSAQAGDGVGGPSVTRVTAPLTAWSADIARPGELPCALQRAVAIAMGEARPVHLNVPTHVAACEISL